LRYLDRLQPLGLLVLRIVLGVIFVGHGYHKVNGHMQEFAGHVASMHIPAWLGYVATFTEFLGGILIMLGLFTRFVAVGLLIDMIVAIAKVHWPHGLIGTGGYEFPLSLAAIAFSLIFFGAGPIAIDSISGSRSGGFPRGRGKAK
jgi:putative oxidoreductase